MPTFTRRSALQRLLRRNTRIHRLSSAEAHNVYRPTIAIGKEYEFYCEVQQVDEPADRRLRRYTGQAVTVVRHLTRDEYDGPGPDDPDEAFDVSRMFVVRAADSVEFEAHAEELNGWDRDLGQYFNADGTYGPGRETWALANER